MENFIALNLVTISSKICQELPCNFKWILDIRFQVTTHFSLLLHSLQVFTQVCCCFSVLFWLSIWRSGTTLTARLLNYLEWNGFYAQRYVLFFPRVIHLPSKWILPEPPRVTSHTSSRNHLLKGSSQMLSPFTHAHS